MSETSTVREAAQRLGTSEWWVRKQLPHVPHLRLGNRRVVFTEDQFAQLIEHATRKPENHAPTTPRRNRRRRAPLKGPAPAPTAGEAKTAREPDKEEV